MVRAVAAVEEISLERIEAARERIRVAPGINLNLSRRGAGVSVGPRGAKLSVGRRGTWATLSLLGTGLSYAWKLSKRSR